MTEPLHPIQVVADRTGLTAHVIRIWEKRYGAVTPLRTGTNRRLYTEEQISRLGVLRRLAKKGHGIGYVAKLPTAQLTKLLEDAPQDAGAGGERGEAVAPGEIDTTWLMAALAAVRTLDAAVLDDVLQRAEVALGAQGVLQRLIAPLLAAIGQHWRDGEITPAHEHFATAVVRLFLSHAARPFAGAEKAPVVVVVTPAGQLHELGALLVAAAAVNLGWRVTYLGAGLAAADIAGAAKQNRARAVALSIIYPEDDAELPGELTRLRRLLPETAILAGGRAAAAYQATLDEIGARRVDGLAELGVILDSLRKP